MKKINSLYIGFWVLLLCSCNSWLDVELKGTVEEEKLFSTEQGFKEALAGVYSRMGSYSAYGRDLTFGALDVFGQVYDYSAIGELYRDYKTYDYAASNPKMYLSLFWAQGYTSIAAINNVLRWMDKKGNVLSTEARQQITGEALALRAFLHYDLYRMFAPNVKVGGEKSILPYNKVFGVETPDFCSTKEYIASVLADLEEALQLLETDPIRNVIPWQLGIDEDINEDEITKDEADKYVARMNYYGVKALMARVMLDADKPVEARRLADDVIESGKFRLVNKKESIDVRESYVDVLFSDEHIFSIRNSSIPDNSKEIHITADNTGSVKLPVPGDIGALYEGTYDDIRLAVWFKDGKLEKYVKNNQKRFYPKVALIRLAEMYLISAEGWINDDPVMALKRLNDLRMSRNNEIEKLDGLMQKNIVDEYRREFIGEGQIFYMYKRLNQDIVRFGGMADVIAGEKVFVFPVPEAEWANGNR